MAPTRRCSGVANECSMAHNFYVFPRHQRSWHLRSSDLHRTGLRSRTGDYNVKADAAAVCHKETSETAIYLSPDNLNLNSFRMIASSTCPGIPDGPRAGENVHLR
ncbi:hypothetical protein ZHAS_00017897 [Anopheles sinensis]|uniref:Uncharacterized protein n=1 Tax=Anopheles sinensis TaxID=74873 RepID=A0A084WI27_ANOSI|nr:hypothetical protein ZHAS_00017897 [Anopheles sinensis]